MVSIPQFSLDMWLQKNHNPFGHQDKENRAGLPVPAVSRCAWYDCTQSLHVRFCSAHFLGHFTSPIFSVFLCHTPNLLSVKPKWLCLPASLLSISFPYSSLHPVRLLSPPQLALGLCPGGLFALEDHDSLRQCLHRCWGTAMDWIVVMSFLCRHSMANKKGHNKWIDGDRVYSQHTCWATF